MGHSACHWHHTKNVVITVIEAICNLGKEMAVDLFCKFLSVQVLATAADPNLGGRNFDEILMAHFVEDFKVS